MKLSIPALLDGIADYLGTKLGAAEATPTLQAAAKKKVMARDGENGAPLAAWKNAMEWFIGVYFGGAEGSSRESHALRYTVGIDLTRMIPLINKGKPRTDTLLRDTDTFVRAGRVVQLMMGGRSIVANACNAKLTPQVPVEENMGMGFHDNFETCSMSRIQRPNGDWTSSVGDEVDGDIVVISMTFSGIKFRQSFQSLFGEDE